LEPISDIREGRSIEETFAGAATWTAHSGRSGAAQTITKAAIRLLPDKKRVLTP